MRIFGLIGENLEKSFSSKYFQKKFLKEKIMDAQYINLELTDIMELKKLVKKHTFSGLNITMPYKESVIPLLDGLSKEAKEIGAVNTICLIGNKLIGYNTDYIGFTKSIQTLLESRKKALILGNGGAAKAIKYALRTLNIEYKIVTRRGAFNYVDVTKEILEDYNIIINTTPIGAYPLANSCPKIPYEYLNERHLLFDLTYNPNQTKFLSYGKKRNTQTKNGLEMLHIQAEESWNIWNSRVTKY